MEEDTISHAKHFRLRKNAWNVNGETPVLGFQQFAFVLPYGPLLGAKDQTYWEHAKGSFCPETGQLLLEVIPDHLPGPAAVSYKPRPASFCRREWLQGREAAIKCLFPLLNLISNLIEKDFLNTAFTTGQILNYKENLDHPGIFK